MKICPTCGATYPDNVQVCPKDGAKLVVQGASQQQSYVLDGRFKIGSVLEQRPIGAFYDGEDTKNGGKVVVFINNPAILPDAAAAQRAIKEWELQGKVSGAQKVRHVGSIPDGRIYAALEPLPKGMTLASRIAKGVIPFAEAAGYLRGISEVLGRAASMGLIHRELGPSNVYLLEGGGVMLLNFPMAQTVLQGVSGDPWFMSPEQAQGRAPGLESLVYSAGALFYYMVVGRPPFPDTDYKALVQHHIKDAPMPPSQARQGLPAQLDGILAKAMSKNPAGRFPSPEALASEVSGLAGGDAQTAQPSQPQAPQQGGGAPVPLGSPKEGAKRSPRRRKKGGFRETLWFKKGAEMNEEDEEKKPKEGEISDEYKDLEERYKDGTSNLTEEDRAKYSVRTGRTGVFQAVKVEDAKVIEKKRQKAELEMMAKRQQKRVVIAGVSIVVIALLVVGGIFYARKVMYKPYLKAEKIVQLDSVLKSVKAPPKKWILPSGTPDKLITGASEALGKGHVLLPKGSSAVEYILAAEKAGAKGARFEKVKNEVFLTVLSSNHLLKHSKDLAYLERAAEGAAKLRKDHAVVGALLEVVRYYKKQKKLGLKPKKPISDILANLPEYPAPKAFEIVKRPKSLPGLLKAARKALKKGRVLMPSDSSAVSYWMTYLVNRRKEELAAKKPRQKRLLAKRLKKLASKEKSILSDINRALEDIGSKAEKKKDWRTLSLTVKAMLQIDSSSKVAQAWLDKYGVHFPPATLKEVKLGKIAPPKR